MDSNDTGWGGARENSGRSKLHKIRKNITVSLTQEQWDQIDEIVEKRNSDTSKWTTTRAITDWTIKGIDLDSNKEDK